jgi:hypothetical protein
MRVRRDAGVLSAHIQYMLSVALSYISNMREITDK